MRNDHFSEIITKSRHALLFKSVGIFINYFLIFYISTKISIEAVGFYNISFVVLIFFSNVFSLGLNFSVTRFIGEFLHDERRLRILYTKSFVLVLIVALLGALLLNLSSHDLALVLFKDENYIKALKLVSYIAPFYVLLIFNIEFIRGLKHIKESEFVRNIFNPTVILLSLFLLTFYVTNTVSAIYAIGISTILGFVISLLLILKFNKGIYVGKLNEIKIKDLLAPSIPLMVMGLAAFLLSESGLFILEIFHGSKEVGDYTIIYKISLVASLVFVTSSAIIGPKFAELYWNGQRSALKENIIQVSRLIFLVSTVIFIVVFLLSNTVLGVFYQQPEQHLDISLKVLIAGQFLYAIFGVAGVFLMVTSYQKVFRNIYLLAALLNLILCYILIPKYDVLGASIAISVSYIFLNLCCTLYLFRKEKILAFYQVWRTNK